MFFSIDVSTMHKKISSLGNKINLVPNSKSAMVLGLAACLSVTACNQSDKTNGNLDVENGTVEPLSDETVAENEAAKNNQQNVAESNPNQADSLGKPVSYDVQNWTVDDDLNINIDELDKIENIFGKITTTDKNSLDYASNSAIKYRFMEGDEPYLDIIDSPSYVELGWYYANPNDSDDEKKMSISHAKKAYQVARGLMGEEGGVLVANMLSGQNVKNKDIGEQHVELAKCEFYSCILVLSKEN